MNTIRIAWWIIAASVGGFLALAALSGWFLRDQIYQTFQDPGEPFQTYEPPEGADYASAEAWYLQGRFSDDLETAVFFVHPTTYSGGANWNAELDKTSSNQAVERVILPNYAAPFSSAGPLFVPRYRQAALYTFMNNREDGVLAREFAYQDVLRAFDQFLADIGPSRPILLSGYGQGGLHVLRLLIDRFAEDPVMQARLVTAYIIEHPVPLDLLNTSLEGIPACETPEDVRCIYAFMQVLPSEERRIRILTERTMSWTPDGTLNFVNERRLLCTNPLLAAPSNQYASAQMHQGGVAAVNLSMDTNPAPIPRQTGAQCADGVLFTERPRSALLRRPSRIAEEFREPPYNLFYEDIRLDAARRSLILGTILQEERRWRMLDPQ
ncbi:DUF3089 domain-containing protein [Maricaulis sp.]|uniref:DUF3089 domain-containing protein n=1 Tax=Maricaulis sp. TaxID=1486257 RepID=UPI0026250C4A|nr:DUF3089 domain-containing protein [Maricaulis sp.]